MSDLELLTRILVSQPQSRYDTTSIPLGWRNIERPKGKLAFGILEFDGSVMPHPPLLRAMRQTAEKLKLQGHEVIKFEVPFDSWEASQVYFDIYYQCGTEDSMSRLEQAGEELIAPVKELYRIYNIGREPMSAREALKRVQRMNQYKELFCDAWDQTAGRTTIGRPIDGLICPASPSAGYPHDFLPWWGYTTLFNLLDYPSIILPLKKFKISEKDDPKDKTYKPQRGNPFDKAYQDLYDPRLWKNQPVTLQIIGRPFDDEELIRTTEIIDDIVNNPPKASL
ncbi:hypothetical protein N0V90_001604 [Kalmusia sp. IMI 367209]|nr:hypothetical protein N0V90_001604 [Kalmusia sp. IMI 367209]